MESLPVNSIEQGELKNNIARGKIFSLHLALQWIFPQPSFNRSLSQSFTPSSTLLLIEKGWKLKILGKIVYASPLKNQPMSFEIILLKYTRGGEREPHKHCGRRWKDSCINYVIFIFVYELSFQQHQQHLAIFTQERN